MVDQDNTVQVADDELPEPIQLTPDQIAEVAGGSVAAAAILRKGLPQAQI